MINTVEGGKLISVEIEDKAGVLHKYSSNEEAMESLLNRFKAENPKVQLFYADYRDCFDDKQIQEALQSGYFDDSFSFDSQWDSVFYLKQEIFSDDEMDFLRREEQDTMCDQIYDYCADTDTSTPVKDILYNTGNKQFFYDTNIQIESPDYDRDSLFNTLKELGIDLSTEHNTVSFREIDGWNNYGGNLEILFQHDDIDIQELLDKENDVTNYSIVFTNPCIGVADRNGGSGGYADFKGQIKFPYTSKNIYVGREGYGYSLCEVYGSNLLGQSTLSFEETDELPEVNPMVEKYAQWDSDLKKGICHLEDPRFDSHDTEYINDFPCGNKCNKCGKFFID